MQPACRDKLHLPTQIFRNIYINITEDVSSILKCEHMIRLVSFV
jgi:hypothetical protein